MTLYVTKWLSGVVLVGPEFGHTICDRMLRWWRKGAENYPGTARAGEWHLTAEEAVAAMERKREIRLRQLRAQIAILEARDFAAEIAEKIKARAPYERAQSENAT